MRHSALIELIVEIKKYHALIAALVGRHVKSRYRGSVLGFLWTILNPLCLMAIYVIVFRYFMKSTVVANYPVFLFCGLLPWIWATSALSEGTASIVQSGHLITKSIFPAHILPLVAVLSTLMNFVFSLPILGALLWYYGIGSFTALLSVPLIIMLQAIFLYGFALMLASYNVLLRDVQHLLTTALSFLFFLSPIVYPATAVPERFSWLLVLNPFALFTTCYHTVLFDAQLPGAYELLLLTAWSLAMLLFGSVVYSNHREKFAEMV